MTVGQIRNMCAAYLQVDKKEFEVVVDRDSNETIDIFLTAINNAKKFAQLQFDWTFEEELCYVTTTLGEASWQTMLKESDDTTANVKQIQTFFIRETSQNKLVPLYHHSQKHGAVEAKERLDTRSLLGDLRYLRDDDYSLSNYTLGSVYSEAYQIYMMGTTFEMIPNPTTNKVVYATAHLWFDDYADDADTDFFTDHGHEFLQWAAIVEMNHLFQAFIPQQEGNIAPPIKARDIALTGLVEYNNFVIESGRQPNRR